MASLTPSAAGPSGNPSLFRALQTVPVPAACPPYPNANSLFLALCQHAIIWSSVNTSSLCAELPPLSKWENWRQHHTWSQKPQAEQNDCYPSFRILGFSSLQQMRHFGECHYYGHCQLTHVRLFLTPIWPLLCKLPRLVFQIQNRLIY